MAQSRWGNWLAELESLSPDAPDWAEVDDFIARLQELASAKRALREFHARRREVLQELENLAGEVAYLKLDLSFMREEVLKPDILPEVKALVHSLRQHSELRSRRPQDVEEEERWIKELQQLREKIGQIVEHLHSVCVPPPKPLSSTEPVPSATPEAPEPEGPAVSTAEGIEESMMDRFWRWVEEGDLPGAYWLARAWEARTGGSPIPSWLLAVLQGVRWLDLHREEMIRDLRNQLETHNPPATWPLRGFSLAAALYGALVTPETGLGSWLHVQESEPLASLIGAVEEFSRLGWPLTAEDFRIPPDQRLHRQEQELTELVKRIGEWWRNAYNFTMNYQRATQVWRYLVRQGGPPQGGPPTLDELLGAPMRGEMGKEAVESVRESLQRWRSDDFVDKQIDRIDRYLEGQNKPRIEATARRQIRRRVEEACEWAEQWIRQVQKVEDLRRRARGEQWIHAKIAAFADTVERSLREVRSWLETQSHSAPDRVEQVAYRMLLATVDRLEALIRGDAPPERAQPRWPTVRNGLEAGLAFRLLRHPEIPLDRATGLPLAQAVRDLDRFLLEDCSWEDAFYGWMKRRFYTQARLLLEVMDPGRRPELEEVLKETINEHRNDLLKEAERLLTDVEELASLGVFDDTQRAEWSTRLEVIRHSLQEAIAGGSGADMMELDEELRNIRAALEEERHRHRDKLRQRWESVKGWLGTAASSGRTRDSVEQAVEEAFQKGDLQVIQDYLDALEEIERSGGRVDSVGVLTRAEEIHILEEFLREIPSITNTLNSSGLDLLSRRIRSERRLPRPNLPAPRYEEIARALQAWDRLKTRSTGLSDEEFGRCIMDLATYLGFQPESGVVVQPVGHGPGWRGVRMVMHPRVLPLVPQFGSLREGKYEILCVWERPGTDALANLVAQSQPVLLFYLGRLNPRTREELVVKARKERWQVAVLDECLLYFLGREYEIRLNAFLRCALPYSGVNPYVPNVAGLVPPEMFFGREKMLQELRQRTGPCLVYGGRQLGKSALLRRVQQEFHRPKEGRFATYLDIKTIGTPSGEPVDHIWREIQRKLYEMELIRRGIQAKPDALRSAVLRAVENSEIEVLLLLDEADAFLKADAEHDFIAVQKLKEIMEATERRFRVVFAGLHNVQRFYNMTVNHPLAHLGTPLLVGPLTPREARDLVERPLEAIGFRFNGVEPVLRILSYTNRHPALLQLFCHRLVEHFNDSVREGEKPPYTIDVEDVEEVYRKDEVRNAIRDRFLWTLSLDPRYEAIALSLCLETLTTAKTGFSAEELLELVRQYWPHGFGGAGPDYFRAYLDELEGLGVLVRRDGFYELRSPNLIRLLGGLENIWNRLEELSRQAPSPPLSNDPHHRRLRDGCYSPFTIAQERHLMRAKVVLVFGSPALGLERVPEALRHLFNNVPAEEIPANQPDRLQQLLRGHGPTERLIFVHMAANGSVQERMVRKALEAEFPYTKIIFLFDPAATWAWLELPDTNRRKLEDRAWPTMLERWHREGIRDRLQLQEKMPTDEALTGIEQATGGWDWLLDRFFERLGGEVDPRPIAEQFLSEDLARLADEFRQKVGLDVHFAVAEVAGGLVREDRQGEGIPADLLPEILNVSDNAKVIFPRILAFLERMGVVESRGTGPDREIIVEPITRTIVGGAPSPPTPAK